ncbi:MAG: Uncharacterised protein [Cryomorphaceae bacterium]|nr:MAG: Uncharacterised protein [Cryomorphaceae bacterium]
MIHGYGKMDAKPGNELRRECNFWQQVQHSAVLAERFFDQFNVNLRFPRGGNPVEQHGF